MELLSISNADRFHIWIHKNKLVDKIYRFNMIRTLPVPLWVSYMPSLKFIQELNGDRIP